MDALNEFRSLNLHLIQGQGSHRCRGLWNLLTPRHREDPDCCYGGGRVPGLDDCFLENLEPWKDSQTGLPVVVAHPSCAHTERDDHHEPFRDFFDARGLVYLVSCASWHIEGASLVVIARADVAGTVRLPADESFEPVVHPKWPVPDWEMAEALKLAEEGVVRDRPARLEHGEESQGNWMTALRLYCDTAYRDRTGAFHNLAREQLEHARRVFSDHPELQVGRLYFKNRRDREYVCGPVPPLLSRVALERRLQALSFPPGWGRFRSHQGGLAVARITDGDRLGTVSIGQGGGMNMWSASVEMDGGAVVRTSRGDEPGGFSDSPDFCWPDLESAVRAAVDVWREYDYLDG